MENLRCASDERICTVTGKIKDVLQSKGYIKPGERVEVRLIPDSEVDPESLLSTAAVTEAVTDDERHFFKIGDPVSVPNIEVPGVRQN